MSLRVPLPFDVETKPLLWGIAIQAITGLALVVLYGLAWLFLSATLAGAVVGVRTRENRTPVAINGATAAVVGSVPPVFADGYLQLTEIGGELATSGGILLVVAHTVVLSVVLAVWTGLFGYTAALVSETVQKKARRRAAR